MQLNIDRDLTPEFIAKQPKINRFTSEFETTLGSVSSWPVVSENVQQYPLGTLQMPDNNSLKIKLVLKHPSFSENTACAIWIGIEGKNNLFFM